MGEIGELFAAAINAIAALTIGLSLVYFLAAMVAGLHELRSRGVRLGAQAQVKYNDPFIGANSDYDVYVLIPCLNEEAVIGATVRALADGPRITTIVIDDASDDRTGEIARAEGGGTTYLLRRELPNAREGKGEALNDAYSHLLRLVADRGQDPSKVIVVVMDADGRLSDGAFGEVLPIFDDPNVGGLQLAVRIRNRETNFLTRFQDFQFWSMSAVTQFGRAKTGTVSLGGNGQFTRLSALQGLNGPPWSSSLTEDLDLAITLLSHGWTLQTSPAASVDQQAVESLRRLFVQRRRWYQGHMASGNRLPEVLRNRDLSNATAAEISAYLAVPWVFDLPWSVLWHWTVINFAINVDSVFSFASDWITFLVGLLIWYVLTFAPAMFTSLVYFRRDPTIKWYTAFFMGHSFVVMNYLSFACAWGALWRIVRGHTGWDKTQRAAEDDAEGEDQYAGQSLAQFVHTPGQR